MTHFESCKNLSFLGFPNNYVTEQGNVYTTNRYGHNKTDILTIVKDKDGYCTVNLNYNKVKKNMKVHRLVALCFLENPNNLEQVNHKDGNKENNNVSNLEWIQNKDNAKHFHRVLNKEKHEKTTQNIQKIIQDYSNGMSQSDICKKYKYSATYVHRILKKGDISKWK